MKFPDGFLWGASTAAYQIEGGNERSAFWNWERRRGWEPSGAAANSWELWREDIACLKRLNLNAYRFSVEWSRVEPEPGRFDEGALARYAELAAALRSEGIRPIVCLHHFSEPAWLFERVPAGWRSPEAPEHFLRFAARTVAALRAEVRDWLSFNEPMVWLLYGYGLGHFPPGGRCLLSLERGTAGALESVLGAHREAYRIIHREIPQARVSLAQNIVDLEPARAGAEDQSAVAAWDRFMHLELLDRARETGSLDFLGVNYYTRIFVRDSPLPRVLLGVLPGYAEVEATLGKRLFGWLGGRRGEAPRTKMGWEIVPEGFERVLLRMAERYRLPILVTENGLAEADGAGPEGRREEFLRGHLAAMGRAISGGAKVLGYLHWSLVDNYEWGSFAPRFGLFSVDRADGFRRTLAGGAEYYAQAAKSNSI